MNIRLRLQNTDTRDSRNERNEKKLYAVITIQITVSLPYQKLTRTEKNQISTIVTTAYRAARHACISIFKITVQVLNSPVITLNIPHRPLS